MEGNQLFCIFSLLMMALSSVHSHTIRMSTTDETPEDILRNISPGRSGNLVIGSDHDMELESRSTLFLRSPSKDLRYRSGEIEDQNVANLLAHLLSTNPPLNSAPVDRTGFPPASLFSSPAASLFVVMPGISSDDLYDASSPELGFVAADQEVAVHSNFYSPSVLSYLESVMTASPPSLHGIVNSAWPQQHGRAAEQLQDEAADSSEQAETMVHAFEAPSGLPRATSLGDVLCTSDRRSMVAVFSGNRQVAAALGVAERVAEGSNNVRQYTLDPLETEMVSVHNNNNKYNHHNFHHSIDLSTPPSLLSEIPLNWQLSPNGEELSVAMAMAASSRRAAPVRFAVGGGNADARQFFAELAGFSALIERIASEDALLLADAHPDLVGVGIAGLAGLKRHYGAASPQFRAGLALLDIALEEATDRLDALCQRPVMRQVLALQVPLLPAAMAAAKRSVCDDEWLAGIAAVPIADTFPSVYLSHQFTQKQMASVAVQISELTASLGVRAHLLPEELQNELPDHALRALHDDLHMKNGTYKFSYNDVAIFQFCLWTTVVLAIAITAAACTLFSLHWDGQGDGLYMQTTFVGKDNLAIKND